MSALTVVIVKKPLIIILHTNTAAVMADSCGVWIKPKRSVTINSDRKADVVRGGDLENAFIS